MILENDTNLINKMSKKELNIKENRKSVVNISTMLLVSVFLLSSFLVSPSEAEQRNPMKNPYVCGLPECSLEGNKFNYAQNIRYKYNYRVHVRSEFSGSGENSSDVFIDAKLLITFPTKCQGVLLVEDVELRDTAPPAEDAIGENDYNFDYSEHEDVTLHPKSVQFATDIQEHEMRFAFHDGVIGELCPAVGEENWVINFKRGILSSLQNTMKRFDVDFNNTESDISGMCDVAYSLIGSVGTSLVIEKTKNIESCINRYKTNSILQTTPYDFRKNFAIWPLLRSTSSCNLTIDHNIYENVRCYERHQLVPFSNKQSGAVTESLIELKLRDEEEFQPPGFEDETEIKTRSSLYFNHYPTPKPTHNEIKASRELLRQMCKLGFPDIQRDFIDVFTKFLQTARLLSHEALHQLLLRGSSICDNGKNHLLESLPYIGSTASTQLMRDQIIHQSIPNELVKSWLISLSYLPRPSVDILDIVYSLMDYGKDKNDPEFLLATTAVAHTFCRNHLKCQTFSEIQRIVSFLQNNLRDHLDTIGTDSSKQEKALILLKGLGNVGIISKDFIRPLKDIVLNETLPIDIRLQAVYAHRRLDCKSNKDFFIEIYENYSENTEVRIASYLQAMQCPDYIAIKSIKYILKNEEVNQVGSFVWSHLNNLAKSSSPVRVEAQGLLLDEDLDTKYQLDVRKFSRNFEKSIFFDEYNFGANAESNLIFGTESYIPRTLSLNFTADLFGESVNLFEISARMEGFESMIEKMFGPKGPLNTDKFAEHFKFVRNYFNKIPIVNKDDFENIEKLRFKRDATEDGSDDIVENQSQEISTSISNFEYKLKNNYDDPRASFGMKMFGNDIKHVSVHGEENVVQAVAKNNPLNYIRDIFSGKKITYTKSGVFLDASYDVPLSSGLPLSIHAFGASSIDLRMSGYFKGPDFWSNYKLHVEGKLKPSVSIDVIGTMQSDYFYGATGIRVKSNLYTSSSFDTQLQIRGSKLASVQFSLPQDRNDIFSARSEMIVLRHDNDIVQKGISKRYSNSTCTWPFIDRALGLKVCAEYSLPDVSNSVTQLPSLILSGPINLNIHLDKADLTAKTFSFEYRSENTTDLAKTSFVFHTPNSVIPRIFSANLTSDPNNWNVTMSFKNGDLEHSAVGTYRNTSEETKFEVYLNLDGHKNFALEAGYNRSVVRNGFMYYPKVLLTVNDDNIAGLSGTLKITGKRNIDQYDINLDFQTKKLRANLTGYVINTMASIENRLRLEYQFLNHKVEHVTVDSEFANRSKEPHTTYLGSLKLMSSAYPKYNFGTNLEFKKIEGHFVATIKYNNNNNADVNDEYNTLVLTFNFSKREEDPIRHILSRTSAAVSLQRPKGDIDLKFKIMHEEKFLKGIEHNIYCVLGYAPQKEAKAAFSLFRASRSQLIIDAAMNITIPDFDSCAASIKILEKARNDYNIKVNGQWFSGHSINIQGVYQDKSSSVKTYHHLKLSVMSPSFSETNIDLRYWRDEAELLFEIQTDHNQQPYGILIKFSERVENEQKTYAQVKFRDKLYSVTSNMMYGQPKQLFLEIHLDNIRDLHLTIRGVSNDYRKEIGFEILWDANRDPTQKFAISAEFNAPVNRIYDGNFQLSYPDRTFSGTLYLDASTKDYVGSTRFSWSAYESVEIKLKAGSTMDEVKEVYCFITVNTPFEGWRMNQVDTGFYFHNNHLLANGSLAWANNQKLSLSLLADYQHTSPIFNLEFQFNLDSTIKDVPTASVLLKHFQDDKKLDTEINIRHKVNDVESAATVFAVKSFWLFNFNAHYKNLTGKVELESPFQGYRAGSLSTRFSISDKRQLSGGADLEIEDKRFTMAVAGYVKKLTDNMLVANITTPIEKFKTIIGRFGINERERHIVAEIRAPNRALGVELLFAITAIADFNIKFNLELPMEGLEKITAVAKMKPETVEFRGCWDKIVLGFVGVWRHVSINDFEYSYKVFTPLENLTENGIVIKHIYRNSFDLDSELSLKLATFNIGILVNGQPKSKLLRQLAATKKDSLYRSILRTDEYLGEDSTVDEEDNEEEEEEDDDYDDYVAWNFKGNMEVYTYVWPKIEGFIDVDEIDDITVGSGKLVLPQGLVKFKDFLYYPDMLTMKNTFEVVTPFDKLKEMRIVYHHNVELGAQYINGINVEFLSMEERRELGFASNLTYSTDESESRKYDIGIEVKIPSKVLPKIDLKGNVEIDDGVYRGNISVKTINSQVSIAGNFEKDDDYLDTELIFSLSAPEVPQYELKTYLKKDKSEIENSFNFGYDLLENGTQHALHIDTTWHVDVQSDRYVKGQCKIRTNLVPIDYLETSILFERKDSLSLANLMLSYATDDVLSEYRARYSKNKNIITAELISPSRNFGNVSFSGQTSPTGVPNELQLTGQLHKNYQLFNVEGTIHVVSDIPVEINLKMTPLNNEQTLGTLTYTFDYSDETKTQNVHLNFKEDEAFVQITGSMQTHHPQHWLYQLSVLTSNGILSSIPESNRIDLDMSSIPIGTNELKANFKLDTPWNHLGIDKVRINTNIKTSSTSGETHTTYALAPIEGRSILSWSWIPLEDMHFTIENAVSLKHNPHIADERPKLLKCGLRYANPNRNQQRLACGAHINVNNAWQLEANGSLMLLSAEDIGANIELRLPKPIGDVHKLSGRYRGNIGTSEPNVDMSYEAKYEAEESKRRFASRGHYRNVTDLQGLVRVEWGDDVESDAIETNVQMLRKDERREVSARLLTPLHTEDTLYASGSYDHQNYYYSVAGHVNYPASRQIVKGDIAYAALSDMKGYVNTTTPFQNWTWINADFNFHTTSSESKRYVKATWPDDSATFDLQSTYTSSDLLNRDLKGNIKLDFPVSTRHYANIDYELKAREMITTGLCNIDYNSKKVLIGQYTCKSESRAGYEKDVVDITLENNFKPIGITYLHVAQNTGIDSPHYDMKRAELFELGTDPKKINITGEFHIRNTLTGQEYKFIAIHPNRTVVFTSDFDTSFSTSKQKSKLQLAPTVWIAYDFVITNETKFDNDSQRFTFELSYPKRNLSAEGWYAVTDDSFDSDLTFKWVKNEEKSEEAVADYDEYVDPDVIDDSKPRVMRAALQWRNEALQGVDTLNQTAMLSIRHPSFQQDVTFKGSLYQSSIDLINANIVVNYCEEADHLLTLAASAKDLTSFVGYRNYTMDIRGMHEATKFDLSVEGTVGARPGLYELNSSGRYSRDYLAMQEGLLMALLDLKSKEILYEKSSPLETFKIWGRGDVQYPYFIVNGSFENTPDEIDSEGTFYVNIDKRLVKLEVNMTRDASQNLQMLGSIPDARSAKFDLWRDYEDIRVVDVAYYIRMNHSRLISSQLLWRPKMRAEVGAKIQNVTTSIYEKMSKNIDYWVKTLYTESKDTVKGVWDMAQPYTQVFLDDVGGLRVLQEDVEEFRLFLNQSYEANDFYVKTLVNITMTILDELAIRDHIDSVPKIINEMWQVLGNSGKALSKSFEWLFESLKTSYKKAVELLSGIFSGEAMNHLTALIETGVQKYDKFVKDLHLSFIKYVENIWTKLRQTVSLYWKGILHKLEPSIIRLVHYLETVAWNISKEVFDFLYQRTNELTETPYFHKVSNFTQDIDKLYRDLISNDALTNIRKYTALSWQFFKEKYFRLVPFGTELNDILTELIAELKKLQQLEAIRFIQNKINEIQEKVDWFANEFQVEKRTKQLWAMIINKINHYHETALQVEDKYRDAKTKFIFNPDIGLLRLEQKLPMSWHAFNETPKFEEIRELKVLYDIQEYLNQHNFSSFNIYSILEFKNVLNTKNLLPPFKSHSLLIGSRHYMTFDKKFVTMMNNRHYIIESSVKQNDCSYLLAHDFVDGNFTILLEPSITNNKNELVGTRKLSVITEKQIIEIDMFASAIRIGRNLTSTLPIQIGDSVIYREAETIVIKSSKGFHLNCNMKFDLCSLELDGWYFGKTAGILGNMNNEVYDDATLLGTSKLETQWAMNHCEENEHSISSNASIEVLSTCDAFFKSKISDFFKCFPIIDPTPYYAMCLDLGADSLLNAINDIDVINKGVCTSALAYMESCRAQNVALRVPVTCIHCNLMNGSYVPEGTFVTFNKSDSPSTADIVFIVEAKPCNKDLLKTKSMASVVAGLEKELNNVKVTNNRYSVIAYGGLPPFDSPRAIVYNNEIFANSSQTKYFFDHIKTGNSSDSDTFEAISVARELIFRPGASKSFILLPCNRCNASNMKFDYSTILQVLLEDNIHLHILMDQDFSPSNKRIERNLFGYDRSVAYTQKYLKEQKADTELLKQIKLPKDALGECMPLAIESDGSVFTSRKLKPLNKGGTSKKFTLVFGKRVAKTAVSNTCQTCECSGHDTGMTYMSCTSCNNPNPLTMDYYNERELLSFMQEGSDFDWDDSEEEFY